MEGAATVNQLAYRSGGTISRYPSWLLGGSCNGDHLSQSQVVSAYYGNEVGGPL